MMNKKMYDTIRRRNKDTHSRRASNLPLYAPVQTHELSSIMFVVSQDSAYLSLSLNLPPPKEPLFTSWTLNATSSSNILRRFTLPRTYPSINLTGPHRTYPTSFRVV
jgi:hypothetical protein